MANTPVKIADRKEAKPEKSIYLALTLVIGPWKKLFPPKEFQLIIAEALNYRNPVRKHRGKRKEPPYKYDPCIDEKSYYHVNNELTISGYLITQRRVCLILKAKPSDFDRLYGIFNCHVKQEIKRRIDDRHFNKGLLSEGLDFLLDDLFTKAPLINPQLIQFLIGKEYYQLYNVSSLQRMKASLWKYSYCSVIDYSGALGPVFVEKLKERQNPIIHPYGVIDYHEH